MNIIRTYAIIQALSLLVSRAGVIGWALELPQPDNAVAYHYIMMVPVALLCAMFTGGLIGSIGGRPLIQQALNAAAKNWVVQGIERGVSAVSSVVCAAVACVESANLSSWEFAGLLVAAFVLLAPIVGPLIAMKRSQKEE